MIDFSNFPEVKLSEAHEILEPILYYTNKKESYVKKILNSLDLCLQSLSGMAFISVMNPVGAVTLSIVVVGGFLALVIISENSVKRIRRIRKINNEERIGKIELKKSWRSWRIKEQKKRGRKFIFCTRMRKNVRIKTKTPFNCR